MKKYFCWLAISMIFSLNVAAQTEGEEVQAIRKTIETYFTGWKKGDTTLLSEAMHSSCQLKYFRNGQFTIVDKKTYLSFFKPADRPGITSSILFVDRKGHTAAVKTSIRTPREEFTDYLHLLKLDNKWVIVDKIAFREEIKAGN